MSLPAKPLDDAIAARLLSAVTPLTIKIAFEALTKLEARDKAISAQWHRRIERARYDADLAERRYGEGDPSNRLVASTLEKRWNDAMQRMRRRSPALSVKQCAVSHLNKSSKFYSSAKTFRAWWVAKYKSSQAAIGV
jgi:hypothetical protein